MPTGLWPLFGDAEGYWIHHGTVDRLADRIEAGLAFFRSAGVAPVTVALDLEPPLETTRALLGSGRAWASRARQALGEAADRRRADLRLDAAIAGLTGVDVLAAVPPPIAVDLWSGAPVFGALLGVPLPSRDVAWSPMLYSSFLRRRGLPAEGAIRRTLELCRPRTRRIVGSVGLVGTGKLGDEPTLDDPEELAADVRAARAAGVEEFALFSLEGVLSSARPERWIAALTAGGRG